MLNSMPKALIVLLVLVTALSPAAQASMTVLAPSACAPMMQGQEKGCCGSSCDCTIETRSEDLSAVLPAGIPTGGEGAAGAVPSEAVEILPVSHETTGPSAESPPPDQPLYQTYSEYRL